MVWRRRCGVDLLGAFVGQRPGMATGTFVALGSAWIGWRFFRVVVTTGRRQV